MRKNSDLGGLGQSGECACVRAPRMHTPSVLYVSAIHTASVKLSCQVGYYFMIPSKH